MIVAKLTHRMYNVHHVNYIHHTFCTLILHSKFKVLLCSKLYISIIYSWKACTLSVGALMMRPIVQ